MLYKSFGIKVPVKIYNKNIKKSVIEDLDKYNIQYVYQDKESSTKDIQFIKINDLHFKIKRTTKMKKIFEVFCEKYGIELNNIFFYLNDIKLNENDTLNSLGIEDEDEIEINTRSLSAKRKSSSSRRKTSSSSKRKTSSSSKRTNTWISPTKSIDGKKYKKKISPKN
jgi:small ubiquitin-related modifier